MDSRVDLDVIGVLEGSDKSSAVRYGWDYLRHYEALFAPLRRAPINLIEVGVQSGASLQLWKWYFSTAQIIGVDLDPAASAYAGDRVVIEIGNQMNAGFMNRVCALYPPTIFIDDGSHKAEHMITTFERIFPKLLPGGIYIVEDLGLHFGPGAAQWQTKTPADAPGYFTALATACLARKPEDKLGKLVDSVTFINGAAVIRKREVLRDMARALATADAYLAAQKRDAAALDRLAAYILRHDGPAARADEILDQAVQAGGLDLPRLMLRAEVYTEQKRTEEARECLLQAADWPDEATGPQHSRLAHALVAVGELEPALKHARLAVRMNPRNGGYQTFMAGLEAKLTGGA